MKLFLLAVLLATAVAQEIILAQSDPNTNSVVFPSPNSVIIENFHTQNQGDKTGYGAKWIWIPSGSNWPHGFTVMFKTKFCAPCNRKAKLRMVADNIVKAYLNGVANADLVGTNTVWNTIATFYPNLQCGENTLYFKVTNLHHNSPAGLNYALVQDPDACKCPTPFQIWNSQTCSCQSKLKKITQRTPDRFDTP